MKTVLLVDDDHLVQKSIAMQLENEGYTVLRADNGKNALAIIRESDIDVVVTDILMPEMEGLELIRAIKAERPDLPVIAISGGGTQARPIRILPLDILSISERLGAHNSLAKPFTTDALIRMIEDATKDD